MKKEIYLSLTFALIAALSASLFFFGMMTVFHWTAWICLIPFFLVAAIMFSLMEDKDNRPNGIVYTVLMVLLVVSGFIFARKAVDAILLGGCFFSFVVNLVLCFKHNDSLRIRYERQKQCT